MFKEDGLQSAGGCAQQAVEARNAKTMAAFFIGLLHAWVVNVNIEIEEREFLWLSRKRNGY